jgi:ankyrin repeat protein
MIMPFGAEELKVFFSDLIDYEADDPFLPINPLLYKTPEGDSCLHIAAMRGHCGAIKILLDGGLDIDSTGDMGNTALHYASAGCHREAFDFLISMGANQSIRNEFGKLSGNY